MNYFRINELCVYTCVYTYMRFENVSSEKERIKFAKMKFQFFQNILYKFYSEKDLRMETDLNRMVY